MRILGLLALALTAGLSAQAKGAQSPQPKASPSAPTKPVTAPAIKPADSASKPAAPQAAPEKSAKPATAKDDKPPKGGIEHPELVNRIREVLKYGNSQQVRDTLNTLTRLNEAEQRSLLPELKKTVVQPILWFCAKSPNLSATYRFTTSTTSSRNFCRIKTTTSCSLPLSGHWRKRNPHRRCP